MTSTDLHPEDLLDREMRGDLSPEERDRLLAHVRECAVCRLERMARGDFRRESHEAGDSWAEADAQRLVAALLVPAPGGKAADAGGAGGAGLRAPHGLSVRLRMHHLRLALVAAAVVSVAGWAGAARWPGVRWATFGKLPSSDTLGRSSNTTSLTTAARGKGQLPPPSATPEAPPAPSPVASVSPVNAPPVGGPASPAAVVWFPASRRVASLEPVQRSAPLPAPAGVAAVPPDPATRVLPPPDAAALFARGNQAMRGGDHAGAAHYYRALIEDYPASSEAHDALALLGRMLLDDTDAEGALRCFDIYLRGGGALREDVMLGRALSLRRLGRAGDEAQALQDLVAAYPRSVHTDRARRRLLELGRP